MTNVNKHPTKVAKQRADVKKHYILAPKDFAGQAKAGLSMKMYCKAMGIPIVKANRQSECKANYLYTEGHGFTYNHQNCKKCRDVVPQMLASYRHQLKGEVESKAIKNCFVMGDIKSFKAVKLSDVIKLLGGL